MKPVAEPKVHPRFALALEAAWELSALAQESLRQMQYETPDYLLRSSLIRMIAITSVQMSLLDDLDQFDVWALRTVMVGKDQADAERKRGCAWWFDRLEDLSAST